MAGLAGVTSVGAPACPPTTSRKGALAVSTAGGRCIIVATRANHSTPSLLPLYPRLTRWRVKGKGLRPALRAPLTLAGRGSLTVQ